MATEAGMQMTESRQGVLWVMRILSAIALFAVGGIWSALTGWLLSADADDRAAGKPS